MKNRFILTSILICFVLTSCSLSFEKRHYRKGYHIEVIARHKSNNSHEVLKDTPTRQHEKRIEIGQTKSELLSENNYHKNSGELISVKTPDKPTTQNNKTNRPLVDKTDNTDCDIITMKDGSEIEASIVKITDTEIEYKKCNNKEGPSYVIKSSEILLVKLKNGENYIPKQNTNNNTLKKDTGGTSPVVNILSLSFSVLSFIFMMIGWFAKGTVIGFLILFIIGLLFGIASIVLGAKGQTKNLKGLGMAGIIVGSITTVANLIGLIFILILIL